MAGPGLRQCLAGITPQLVAILAVAALGPLQFGFHLAELNAPQDVMTCRKKSLSTLARIASWVVKPGPDPAAATGFLPGCIAMSEAAFATVSSVFTVGGLAGALCAGPLSSRRGRLPAMRAAALCFALGALIETLAGGVVLFALGRLLAGLGAGATTVVVPLYISETSPPDRRGLLGATTQVSINVGILASQTLGYFWSRQETWRCILAAGACVAVAHAAGMLAVPESPAWTGAHGDAAEARATLQRIRGRDADVQAEAASWRALARDRAAAAAAAGEEEQGLLHGQRPLDALPASPTSSSRQGGVVAHLGFLHVAADPLYRPAVVAVVGIMMAQQLCGINSIIMYSVSLLADLLPMSSALLTIIVSVVNLAMTVACAPLPDRLGRKTCLLLSIAGQGTSSLALALSIMYGAKLLSAAAVLFFVAFFAVGLGPVPFIMASELAVGPEAVGATQSWSLASNYVATFAVAQFFPLVNTALNDALGGKGWVYLLFAALASASAVFVSCKVPETLGKRDADEVWGRTRRMD